MILVDTNIVGRVIQTAHRHHQAAVDAMTHLATVAGEDFGISVHSLYELYFIMTKPQPSGFGYAPRQAGVELVNAQNLYQLLPETLNVYHIWQGLVGKYALGNRAVFDAKIVATAIENKVPTLLTFNDTDFQEFTEITTLNPFDLLGIPRIP